MEIAITPARLIDLAKQQSGLEQQDMANELHIDKSRLSKIKKGVCALTPTEGYYFAMRAGLPFEQTMEELERARDPSNASIWRIATAIKKTAKKLYFFVAQRPRFSAL